MPSIEVVAFNNGTIARVYKSQEEKAVFAQLPPLANIQLPVVIDLQNNHLFVELVDGNNWHRWRLNAGAFTRDGIAQAVHPASEEEADRLALPAIIEDLRAYFQLDALDGAATAGQVRNRVIETQEAVDDLIRALRYIVKTHLKIVP